MNNYAFVNCDCPPGMNCDCGLMDKKHERTKMKTTVELELRKKIKQLMKILTTVINDESGDLDFVQWNIKKELEKLEQGNDTE